MNSMTRERHLEVLMLDTDEEDVFAFRWVLKNLAKPVELIHATSVGDALKEVVSAQRENHQTLVLVNHSMPGEGARLILSELRAAGEIQPVPAVVLCNALPADGGASWYELGARAVVVKPQTMSELRSMLASLTSFWRRAS